MPRYVVLRHDMPAGAARPSHWDFMLECGESLRTWALQQPPDAPEPQLAEGLADHRLAYLEYEGAVSEGRGSVARWDAGSYEPQDETGVSDTSFSIRVAGSRMRGEVNLLLVADAWQFQYFVNFSE